MKANRPGMISLATLFNGALADDVVVTSGSQQALDLISRVLINPGDQVVVGDPEYLGALQLFRSYGANLHPIALDGDGMDTEQLEHQLLGGLRPKCCYIVPNFHNPTGCSMSAERRSHLGQLAQRYGFLIIEDDPYRELFCEVGPSDEVSFLPELTVRLRSISKTLAPGLRKRSTGESVSCLAKPSPCKGTCLSLSASATRRPRQPSSPKE